MAAFRIVVFLAPEISELLRIGRQDFDWIADRLAGNFPKVDFLRLSSAHWPILALFFPPAHPCYLFLEHLAEVVVERKVEAEILLVQDLGEHEH